jgi:hypothetical protein
MRRSKGKNPMKEKRRSTLDTTDLLIETPFLQEVRFSITLRPACITEIAGATNTVRQRASLVHLHAAPFTHP